MKKDKILKGFIIGILVVIIAIVAAMFATGKFDVFKKEEVTEPTAVPVTETTTVPVSGRPKTQMPSSIVAAIYSEYTDKSSGEIAEFSKFGFNTVIFDLTEENADKVASLLETAKSNKLYFGIRADISQNSDYAVLFSEKYNTDFIILDGIDESIGNYTATI
jgi:hypothetical protein